MRKNAVLLLLWLGTTFAGEAVRAQEFPKQSLISRKSWTHFDLILGRITAMNPRYRQTSTVSDGSSRNALRESLSLRVKDGVPSIRYELNSDTVRVVIDVSDGNRVMIQRQPIADPGIRVTYEQPAEGRISLQVEDPGFRQQYSAQNLWELLLAEPRVCDEYLMPLLRLIRPNWQLAKRASRVEESLIRVAQSELFPQREKLDRLVRQLGSGSYKVRQAADLQLRANGHAVLAYLNRLDLRDLDGEQRRRIKYIQRDLVFTGGDTPERVAMWLIDSPSIWLILMESPDVAKRQFAAQRLAQISNEPVRFDPLAAEAERQAVIDALRADHVGPSLRD